LARWTFSPAACNLRAPKLTHEEPIPVSLARASGMKQMVAFPVIENALLKAVLVCYL
jgi:hypothetical protein